MAEISERVILHGEWVRSARERGARLVEHGAALRGADLSGEYLYRADLSGADLRGADLNGTVLTGAYLGNSDLRGVDLSGADLRGAEMSCSDLRGATIPADVPVVADIDAAILAGIDTGAMSLNMGKWHSCGTKHCRAGAAINLAGAAGYALEARLGPNAAGALIYAASGSHPVPDWYASDDEAMADMRRRARGEGVSDGRV